ncbi:hypothetical protein PCE1_001673 [Barthelona sp. PCE]
MTSPNGLQQDDPLFTSNEFLLTQLELQHSEVKITPNDQPRSRTARENAALVAKMVGWRKRFLYTPEKGKLYPDKKPNDPPLFAITDLPPSRDDIEILYNVSNGFYFASTNGEKAMHKLAPSMNEYFRILHSLNYFSSYAKLKAFCYRRLYLLGYRFRMYKMLNKELEKGLQKEVSHRDFYNVRKVDTHVHAASAMNKMLLLDFIRLKLMSDQDRTVFVDRRGEKYTLPDIFTCMGYSPYEMGLDALEIESDCHTTLRFNSMDNNFNTNNESILRKVFLKTDNFIEGAYFADMIKMVMRRLESEKYQHSEMSLTIFGSNINEWDRLARWFVKHKVASRNVRWVIQIPRLYAHYKATGVVENFEQYLANIFEPLFQVSRDPSSHPYLHWFLQHVVAFDTVDDESKPERQFFKKFSPPRNWTSHRDPPFSYYVYFLYSNLYMLNGLRNDCGMNTIALRPHAGESGGMEHLTSTYLTCHGIVHGINLKNNPVLQYLFYLGQIPIAMSPVSNNRNSIEYKDNPFPTFFSNGLNVTLSTDDPLKHHFTEEPLMEEFSIAGQYWKLSSTDLCEIARNSCLNSGFDHESKVSWLGEQYTNQNAIEANEVRKTNVPDVRILFRESLLQTEKQLLMSLSHEVDIRNLLQFGMKKRHVLYETSIDLNLLLDRISQQEEKEIPRVGSVGSNLSKLGEESETMIRNPLSEEEDIIAQLSDIEEDGESNMTTTDEDDIEFYASEEYNEENDEIERRRTLSNASTQ